MFERTLDCYRRNLPHIVAYDRALFVTFATLGRRRLPPCARALALRQIVHGHDRWYWLHVAVVMPDHAHLVLTIPRSEHGFRLRRITKGIKGASARAINLLLGSSGTLWQDESFDHVIRRNEGLEKVIRYVLENPVTAHLVQRADDYVWQWRCWQEGGHDGSLGLYVVPT